MNITRDIQTPREFKQNASKLIKQVQETKQPVILTVNGKPAAVVQDVDSFQRLTGDREYWETVRALKRSLESVRNGEQLVPAEDVFNRITKKYGVSFE